MIVRFMKVSEQSEHSKDKKTQGKKVANRN